jgi:hypothetical protein
MRLSESDARILSQRETLKEIHDDLGRRLRIKRATPGVRSTDELQKRLAVIEVGMGEAGVSDGAGKSLLDKAIEAERQQAQNVSKASDELRDIEREMKRMAEEMPSVRLFIRKATRLYAFQRSDLRRALNDSGAFHGAMGQLDDLFGRFLARAITVGE